MPCFLLSVFDELIEAGLLTLAEPDPCTVGLRRTALTCEGNARFTALSEREHQWPARLYSWENRETHQEQGE